MKKIFHSVLIILLGTNLSAQNVGIGTVSPESKLSIKGEESGIGTSTNINYHLIRSGKHIATGTGIPILSLAGAIGTLRIIGRSADGSNYTTQEYRVVNGGWNYPLQASITNLATVSRGSGVSLAVTSADGGAGDMNVLISATSGSLIYWSFDGLSEQINNNAILPSVRICGQIWTTKNLDVDHYRNGDPIPQVTDPGTWASLTTGAWCWYNNDSATFAATYGRLYNWYAVNDIRGLAPTGWHVPSSGEWATLSTCLGGDAVAGGKMKESGIAHWSSPNTGATNSSGFTGLPGGGRFPNGTFSSLDFYAGQWWSASEYSASSSWYRLLFYNTTDVNGFSAFKSCGFSVRLVRN